MREWESEGKYSAQTKRGIFNKLKKYTSTTSAAYCVVFLASPHHT